MPVLNDKSAVLEAIEAAGKQQLPLLCPNAETPDEMEGLLLAAEAYRRRAGLDHFRVGVGVTATYPDHPQLGLLAADQSPHVDALEDTVRMWFGWLALFAEQPRFSHIDVIPFLDHGWVAHAADRQLMAQSWFQDAMGIIMYDASSFDYQDNVRLTAEYVTQAGDRVVVEACPDKVYERDQIERLGLNFADMLSDPDSVERFVRETRVDLIVPNLGTEHRSVSGEALCYRSDLARELCSRIGPRLALHGTSSLGENVGSVGKDGICKVNYYTAMARDASTAVRSAWKSLPERLPVGASCGAFVYRTRREAVYQNLSDFFHALYST